MNLLAKFSLRDKRVDRTCEPHLMKVPKVEIWASAIISATLLTGCAHTPQGYVAKEWSSTMRELGITPVFPPREDVQVGDVYISPISPDAEVEAFSQKGFLPLGLWLTHLDVAKEVTTFYSSRPSFPLTPSDTANFMASLSNNPFASLAQAADTNRNIFLGGDTNRLRMVGFPTFMSATFNKGDLAAVVPVEAVNLAFGAGFTSARSVTVSVPVAESYGLPADIIWPKIMNANGTLMDLTSNIPRSQLNNLVNMKQVVQQGTNFYAPLRVITEVFYTRALDISVASQTTRGFGVAGRPIASDVASTAAGAAATAARAASNSSSTNAVFISPGVTNLNANAVERAAEMNNSLTQAMSQTVPGGSIKFVAAGDRGVSLRRTYDRPIAIGYHALNVFIPIDSPNDAAFFGKGGVGNGWVPTARGGFFLSPQSVTNTAPMTNSSPPPNQSPQGDLQPGKPVPSQPK